MTETTEIPVEDRLVNGELLLMRAIDHRESPAWQEAWWRWRAMLAGYEASESDGAAIPARRVAERSES